MFQYLDLVLRPSFSSDPLEVIYGGVLVRAFLDGKDANCDTESTGDGSHAEVISKRVVTLSTFCLGQE